MSELAAIVALPDTTTLPGHTLSRFRLRDFAECEEEFAAKHLRTAALAGKGLEPKDAADLRALAMADVARGYFSYGRAGFGSACFSAKNIPFILWVCLKIADSKMTLPEAEGLINDDNEAIVHNRVLKLMRFTPAETSSPNRSKGETATAKPPTTQEVAAPQKPSETASESTA